MPTNSSACPLIDIGLNLANPRFSSDWREVILRAQKSGVARFILTGTSLAITQEVAGLAGQLAPGVAFFTAGVHPHRASEWNAKTLELMRALLARSMAVAVGETGLDYHRNLSPRQMQRASFEAHVLLACKLQKPLFIHERAAASDLLAILDDHKARLPACVVHCFTGDAAQAQAYIERGFYLGLTGWLGQNGRNKALLEAVPAIPANRLMLETDAPYLMPPGYVPVVSGRNEPSAMVHVAELVAKVRGTTLEQVRADAYATTMKFFRIPG